jgi:lactoylglutathione lyase|tara:strand:+ start:163 stop:555 length:393 start_codon:yes stop_codon:yes gene_type:complete
MASRLTHLALPCHDLDATIRWYEKYTPLRKTHHRQDSEGAVAWLSPAESEIVLVFIQKNETSEPIAVLTPLAHLGIALDSTNQVDRVAARGESDGCLAWEPRQESDPVGYICALSDPDGNLVEFSYGQEI